MKNTYSLSQHRSVWEIRSDSWINLVEDIGDLTDLEVDHVERVKAHVIKTCVKAYSTHPTGKILIALCQDSMINVWDRDFEEKIKETYESLQQYQHIHHLRVG